VIIKEVQAVPFTLPYREPFRMSTGTIHAAENVLVMIIPDRGPVGLGETQPVSSIQGCGETQLSVVQVIRKVYVPILVNRDPSELNRIAADLEAAAGACPYSRAAVMDALYDLFAKSLHVPLYKILGGHCRSKLEMVWPIGMSSERELEREAKTALERHYRKIKLKVGAPDPRRDIDRFHQLQRLANETISLRVDANAGYSYAQALKLLRALKTASLDIFEQPLSDWDYAGLARLAGLSEIAIMADESCTTVQTALELISIRAASIFDLKLPKNGGIHFAKVIADIAGAANIPVYPGSNPSSSIGAAAAIHFFASLKHCLAGDFNVGQAKSLSGDITKQGIRLDEPFAYVPDGEGIGLELDEKKLGSFSVSLN
jgi:muconate cycloisomerase